MSVPSSEIIARIIDVLGQVCLLLEEEVDARTTDPLEQPRDAVPFAETAEAIRRLLPKLQTVRAAMTATEG